MKGKETGTTAISNKVLSETACLPFIIGKAIENHYAVAVWQLPNDDRKYLIVSRESMPLRDDALLEELSPGFIVAPFDDTAQRIYLKADFCFTFSDNELIPAGPAESASAEWLHQQLQDNELVSAIAFYRLPYRPTVTNKNDYINTVVEGIREIEKGTFEKIVPSRTMSLPLPSEFDYTRAFQELCQKNPNAMVSLVSSAATGTWLGASPELLVSVTDRSVFRTIALAATQAYIPGTDIKTVAWTQKDIEEQALVERYIVNCFKEIRLREFDEHGPKTVLAGSLLHLKTEFSVDMDATNFPQLGTVMLRLLHPTSAVCGVPLEPSLSFIQSKEGYDRQYYCGYLGPVNVNQAIHIFVNLRCAQLLEDQAVLYAGAGITIDSIPEQEWLETQIKMNTLLDVLSDR
jgi:isochorismate synthase